MKNPLIGKKVKIPSLDGKFHGDWGTVIDFDGDVYHVAFADDKNNVLVFDRKELKVIK